MEKIKIRWEGAGWYYWDTKDFPKQLLYHSRLDNPRAWAAPHWLHEIPAGPDGDPELPGVEFEKV